MYKSDDPMEIKIKIKFRLLSQFKFESSWLVEEKEIVYS